jgi:hypothetical protein
VCILHYGTSGPLGPSTQRAGGKRGRNDELLLLLLLLALALELALALLLWKLNNSIKLKINYLHAF